MSEINPCPRCGALPCDWVDDPHAPSPQASLRAALEAMDDLASRIDADGTASQIGSAEEIRAIAAALSQPSPEPSEEEVELALAAFNTVINNPQVVPCKRCEGKGFHHGFGEDGNDPDWCSDCGGGGYDVPPGEEKRAMRAAISALHGTRP